jgi:hypothetical protein
MAKTTWLRNKEGVLFGYNAILAENPAMETVELDLDKPQETKSEDTPKSSKKKAASRKPPTPLVADSEEELNDLIAGLDTGAEDS